MGCSLAAVADMSHLHSARKKNTLKYEVTLWLDHSGCCQGRPSPRQPWRNLPPLLSPSSLRLLPLLLFNEGPGVSTRENFGIKDVCRYIVEHFDGLMRLFSLKTKRYIPHPISLFLSPDELLWRIFRCRGCIWTPLVAADQKANLKLRQGQPAEVHVCSTRQ